MPENDLSGVEVVREESLAVVSRDNIPDVSFEELEDAKAFVENSETHDLENGTSSIMWPLPVYRRKLPEVDDAH